MARSITIPGAAVKVKINGKTLPSIQSMSWVIDYGEKAIYGIDSEFPQEIATTKQTIKGTVQNVRVRFSKGLQGINAVPTIQNFLTGQYHEMRVIDRQTNKVLLVVEGMKVSNQSYSVPNKGVVTFSFSFIGIAAREELDEGFATRKRLAAPF